MSFQQFDTLRTVSAADLLSNPPVPRAMILAPWLRERDAVLLWAPTGAGKSQVAMSAALAVAGGVEVLGWTAPEPRPVLYVDGEMDRGDLVERLELLRHATNPPIDAQALGRLHFLARDCHGPDVQFPDLSTPEGHALILAQAKACGAALVILDNLSTLATVEDENSAAAIKPVMDLVQKLRQQGCTPFVVHHASKGGENYRGTSNIATTFAWIVGLKPTPGAPAGLMDVAMVWQKTRGGANEATVEKRVRLRADASRAAWDHGPSEHSQAAALAQAIRSRKWINVEEAGKAIGLQKTRAYELKREILAAELMREVEMDRAFKEAKALREEIGNPNRSLDF
ncbi:AAA family ATPase [Piscinibacterium candidicorallinum]|uniref:AAA family ATPase n=1 Tax=Piscinibacterium candidicorallinum TaxID=1793872 RepID=A0ABV7H9C3_9BURK